MQWFCNGFCNLDRCILFLGVAICPRCNGIDYSVYLCMCQVSVVTGNELPVWRAAPTVPSPTLRTGSAGRTEPGCGFNVKNRSFQDDGGGGRVWWLVGLFGRLCRLLPK